MEPEQLSVETTTPWHTGRVTRKKILTEKYSDLLSRKAREEYIQDNDIGEVESIPLEPEVLICLHFQC